MEKSDFPTLYNATNADFTASFTMNVPSDNNVPNLPVTFTDTSGIVSSSWNWTFKDYGNTTPVDTLLSYNQNPSTTFGAGNFSITLNASSWSHFSTTSKWINISAGRVTGGLTLDGVRMWPNDHVFNTKVNTLPMDVNSSAYVVNTSPTGDHLTLGTYYRMNVVDSNITPVTVLNTGTVYPTIGSPFQILDYARYEAEYPSSITDHWMYNVNPINQTYNMFYQGGLYVYPRQANGTYKVQRALNRSYNNYFINSTVSSTGHLDNRDPMPPRLLINESIAANVTHVVGFSSPWPQSVSVRTPIWPIYTEAGNNITAICAPIGQRFRLNTSLINISSGCPGACTYTETERHILQGLADYGMILTDISGPSSFGIQAEADDILGGSRWNYTSSDFNNLTMNKFDAVDERALMISSDSGQVNGDLLYPLSIENLVGTPTSCSGYTTSVLWTWTNSTISTNFNNTKIYQNNVLVLSASNTTHTTTWTGLPPNTAETFSSQTCNTAGLCNSTWVNATVTTGYCGNAPTFGNQNLKLLLHGNYEVPSTNSTGDFRDSSHSFLMPYSTVDKAISINTTYKKYGNASIKMTSTSDLNIVSSPVFDFKTNNMSISMSVNYSSTAAMGSYLWRRYQDANWYESMTAGLASIVMTREIGGVAYTATCSPWSPVANQWYNISYIQNGTSGQIYVNGTACGSPLTASLLSTTTTGPVTISGYNGYIDEVKVYNGGMGQNIGDLQNETPLYLNGGGGGYADDDYTISLMHFEGSNGGTFIRDQFENRTITPGSVTTSNSWAKFGGTSGYFDTGGYLSSTYDQQTFNMGGGDWTFDGWVEPTAGTTYFYLADFTDSVSKGYSAYCTMSACTIISNQSGSYAQDINAATTFTPGIPTHLVFERAGTTLKIYRDGNLIGSQTIPASYQYNTDGLGTAYILAGTKTYFDEVRASKGIARFGGSSFTPPSYPYELTYPSFTSDAPKPSAPVLVTFTDTTQDDAWTNDGYQWTFGDGGYSTLKNPTHVYAASGVYTATETVYNNNMSATASGTVGVGGPVVDFSCTPKSGTAALLVTCTDLTANSTPITSYLMDWGDTSSTTVTPPWTHVYSTFGSFSLNLTETNSFGSAFNYKRDYIVTSTAQNQQQTFYSPHQTKYKIVDGQNNPLPNSTVVVYYISTSLPNGNTTWLSIAYGIPIAVANDMVNSNLAMQGTTGIDGSVVFTQHGSIYYKMLVSNSAISVTNYSITLMPLDNDYVLRIQDNPYNNAVVNNTYMKVTTILNTTVPNSSYLRKNLYYQDAQGYTTSLRHVVWNGNNGTVYRDVALGNPGAAQVYDYLDVLNTKGDILMQNYTAVRVTP